MMKLIYFVLFASFGVNAAESFTPGSNLFSAMEAYSRSANLRPLNPSDADELRIWTYSYMGGGITGYVVSKRHTIKCQMKSHYSDNSVTIDSAQCRRIWFWNNRANAIGALDHLSVANGKEWDCPMFDGAAIYIDGVRNGKRISLRVGNPGACSDQNSKAVLDLLRTLPE